MGEGRNGQNCKTPPPYFFGCSAAKHSSFLPYTFMPSPFLAFFFLAVAGLYRGPKQMNFGVYCGSAHYYTRGLALLQRARALCIMAVTTSSGDLSGISLQIGSLLLECQQFEAAIPYLEEALGVQAQHLAHETVILINSHRLLLRAHHGYNNFRKALDHAKKATELSARHYGEDHERTKEAQQLVVRCTTDAVAVQRMLVSLQKKQPQAFAAPAVVSKESITNNHAEGKKKKDNKNPVRSNATTAPATAPQ